MTWPSRRNRIAAIRYALTSGFDASGNPSYVRGTVESEEDRDAVQSLLESLRGGARSIAATAIGEIHLDLEDGTTVMLRPVFHPSRDRYGDLFFTDDAQYPMPPQFAELLERWRSR